MSTLTKKQKAEYASMLGKLSVKARKAKGGFREQMRKASMKAKEKRLRKEEKETTCDQCLKKKVMCLPMRDVVNGRSVEPPVGWLCKTCGKNLFG